MSMEISSISSVGHIDLFTIREVLTSDKITESDKNRFIRRNQAEIRDVLQKELTAPELAHIMKYRPLIKYRPIKNSYTKAGDKIILAKALGISPGDIPSYINTTTEAIQNTEKLTFLSEGDFNKVKTYVYRHGKKNEVIKFLEHELDNAKNITKTLYDTLQYGNGGIADYFERPIHRLDNKTLLNLYGVIEASLSKSHKKGSITENEYMQASKVALIKIYEIQNNQKIIHLKNTLRKIT